MNDVRKNTVAANKISDVQVERVLSKYLFIDACSSQFLDIEKHSNEFVKNTDGSISAGYFKFAVSLIDNVRTLSRMIPTVDTVQLFYDGSLSVLKILFPVAILARFFGKEVRLFYYPGESFFQIKKYHFKLFSLFSSVVVGSRYVQRDFAKRNIQTEVQVPFVDTSLVRSRTISGVQPHIILIHESPDDSGAVCAMRAFKFVKQKYPRTELTVVTKRVEDWQSWAAYSEQNYSGINYIEGYNGDAIKSALSKIDIYINCDLSETMPLSLVAAMSGGVPCISYETYGPREIIEHGVNGFLVRHNDSNQLADRIIELIEHPEMVEDFSKQAAKLREKISPNRLAGIIS